MSDLGVVEHGDLVAGITRSNEASVREAIGAPSETPVQEPRVSEPPPKVDDGETPEPAADKPTETLTPFRKGAKPRDDAFARMKQATDQAKEAKQAREAAEQRANAAEARLRELEHRPAVPVRQPEAPPAPSGPKFTFPGYDAYVADHPEATYEDWGMARTEAYADWRDDQRQQVYQQQQQADRRDAALLKHRERVGAVQAQYPDWQQVIDRMHETFERVGAYLTTPDGRKVLPPTMMDAIVESERSADVLYYLGTHPDVAVQLTRESAGLPVAAARFIRESIESKIGPSAGAITGSASPPKQSRAASPPSPVKGSPTATPSGSLADLSPDEAIERYRKTKSFS